MVCADHVSLMHSKRAKNILKGALYTLAVRGEEET